MLTEEEVEFLKTLVFNDLNLKYTGNSIESLMNCGDIHFNIPKQDVKFRRNLLTKLTSVKIQSHSNRPIPPIAINSNDMSRAVNKAKGLSAAQINVISGLIIDQKKLEAIKMLRTYTGLGLREAKEFMDLFIPTGTNLPSSFSYINAANAFADMCV